MVETPRPDDTPVVTASPVPERDSVTVDRPAPGGPPLQGEGATPAAGNRFRSLLRRNRGPGPAATSRPESGPDDTPDDDVLHTEFDDPLKPMSPAKGQSLKMASSGGGRLGVATGLAVLVSLGWIGMWGLKLGEAIVPAQLGALPPQDLAAYVALLLLLPTLLLLGAGHIDRGRRLNRQTEAVIRHLALMGEVAAGHPGETLEVSLRHAEKTLRRQVALLGNAANRATELSARLTVRLAEQRATLEEGSRAVDEFSQRARSTLMGLTDDLALRVTGLTQGSDHAIAALEAAGAALREQERHVSEMGVDATMLLANVGETFSHQSEHLSAGVRKVGDTVDELGGRLTAFTEVAQRQLAHLGEAEGRVNDWLRRVDEALGGQRERIGETGQRIQDQTQKVQTLVEGQSAALDRLLTAMGDARSSLESGSEQALDRLQQWNDGCVQVRTALETADTIFAHRLEAFAQEAQTAQTLADRLTATTRNLETTTHQLKENCGAMEEVGTVLTGRIETLAAGADVTMRTLSEAGKTIELRTLEVGEAVRRLNEEVKASDTLLSTQVEAVGKAVGGASRHVDGLGQKLSSSAALIQAVADEAADRLDQAIHTLDDRTHGIQNVAQTFTLQAQDLLASSVETGNTLETLAGKVHETAAALAQSGSRRLEEANVLGQRLEEALVALRAEDGRTSAQLRGLTHDAEVAEQRLATLHATLDAAVSVLRTVAERAGETLEAPARLFDERTHAMSGLAETLAAHVASIDRTLNQHSQGLLTSAERASATLAVAGSALESQGQGVENRLEQARALLGQAGDLFTARFAVLEETTDRARHLLHGAGGDFIREAGSVTDAAQRATSSLAQAGEGLDKHHRWLEQTSAAAGRHLEEVRASLSQQADDLQTVADAAAARLASITETLAVLAAQSDPLTTLTGQAQTSLETLRQTSEGTVAQMMALKETVAEGVAALAATADGGTRQIAGLVETLAAGARTLDGEAAAVETRLALGGDTFAARLETLGQASAAWNQHLETAAQALSQHTETLDSRAQRIESGASRLENALTLADERIGRGARHLEQTAGLLESHAQTAGVWLTDMGNTLRDRADQVAEVTHQARMRLDDLGSVLRQRNEDLTQLASGLTARLEAVALSLPDQIDRINEAAREALDRLTATAGALSEPNDGLNDLSQTIDLLVSEAERAITLFRGQADDLASVAQSARQRLEASAAGITLSREGEARAAEDAEPGDPFLQACGEVIERLEHRAIDIAAALAPEALPTGRPQGKADRAALVRRLCEGWNAPLAEQTRLRAGDETAFKALVDDYLDRFGDLFAQQSRHGMPNVLNSVFLSCDLGRLYLNLARATGRL